MRLARAAFLARFDALCAAQTPFLSPFAWWKLRALIEDGEAYALPEQAGCYLIRDGHLLMCHSPDGVCHIPPQRLAALRCISLPVHLYEGLAVPEGFMPQRGWKLAYDFAHVPTGKGRDVFEAVDFDFADDAHYALAAEIIRSDGGDMQAANVRRMRSYEAFDPAMWFFVRRRSDAVPVAISISAYDRRYRETDLDWIFVLPAYQGSGAGRFLVEETIRRCIGKSSRICVGGTVDFYRRCGFRDDEEWVWAKKPGYTFTAPRIQP